MNLERYHKNDENIQNSKIPYHINKLIRNIQFKFQILNYSSFSSNFQTVV